MRIESEIGGIVTIQLPDLKQAKLPCDMTEKQYIKLVRQEPSSMINRNTKMQLTGKGYYQTTLPALTCLLPDENSVLKPFRTCPNAKLCAGFCYAAQGTYRFKGSIVDHVRKLYLLENKPERWKERMIDAITRCKNLTHLRWHDAGDFYNSLYLGDAVEVMLNTPHIQHYTYTKMVSMFETVKGYLPNNFTWVYSYGGKEDHLIKPKVHRHSRIFANEQDLKKARYASGVHSDYVASDPSFKDIGLVYHGNKKFSDDVFAA